MKNERGMSVTGVVTGTLPHAMYQVQLTDGKRILAHIPPALRMRIVRIVPGDRVALELYPYDPSRGRITERLR